MIIHDPEDSLIETLRKSKTIQSDLILQEQYNEHRVPPNRLIVNDYQVGEKEKKIINSKQLSLILYIQ